MIGIANQLVVVSAVVLDTNYLNFSVDNCPIWVILYNQLNIVKPIFTKTKVRTLILFEISAVQNFESASL